MEKLLVIYPQKRGNIGRERLDRVLKYALDGMDVEVYEDMDVLWDAGEPLSRADLLEHSEEKSWKDSSVHILLNGLLQKGAIEEAGFVRRSKTYGRTFVPTMSREQYFATTIFSHRYQPDMIGLLEALLSRPEVDENVLESLKEMLNRRDK